jgi:subtilase family serine protease
MKLGAVGVTVVVSSGDDGAPGNLGDCKGKPFDPPFPASSPWVTTVGATMLSASTAVTT